MALVATASASPLASPRSHTWSPETTRGGQSVTRSVSARPAVEEAAGEVSPPPPAAPSGEPMPVGNLPGWRQIFTDDFTRTVPLGSFPGAVSSTWGAYPYPWRDSPRNGRYHPGKTVSWHDGMADIWLRTENGEHLVAALAPKINGPNGSAGQLYGRYAIRFQAESFPGYKAAWLLWPTSEIWPRDGEIDFPEGSFDGLIDAFMHRRGATSGGDQDVHPAGVPFASAWHTAVIEWSPGRVKFFLDGRLVGSSASRVPNRPMRWVIQNETENTSTPPPDWSQGHVFIDWVAVYARASVRW
ncbi:MAG: glycoside hydrolase family 16 protein [Actinobacteria bacterium]|nr:glycoside hydrolase family 16 protein [Actinomycetota bacterium]